MRRRMIIAAVCLGLSVTLAVGALFAWFTGGTSYIDDLTITTASIKISAQMYRVNDFNDDGIFDIEEDGVPSLYGNAEGKPHDYLLDGKLPVFSGMYPGKTLTFLLRVTNESTKDCRLNLFFDVLAGTQNGINNVYGVHYVGKDKVYHDADDGTLMQLLTETSNKLSFTEAETITVGKGGSDTDTYNFYFSVRFERLSTLQTMLPDTYGALTDLNDYRGLMKLDFRAELEQFE